MAPDKAERREQVGYRQQNKHWPLRGTNWVQLQEEVSRALHTKGRSKW